MSKDDDRTGRNEVPQTEVYLANDQINIGKIVNLYFQWFSIKYMLMTKTSAESYFMAIEQEDVFKCRFGCRVNRKQREHVIAFKKQRDVTDAMIRMGIRTRQIIVTDDGVTVKRDRLLPMFGWLLLLILMVSTADGILSIQIPPGHLSAGPLWHIFIHAAFALCVVFFLRIVFMDPSRQLKQCGLG